MSPVEMLGRLLRHNNPRCVAPPGKLSSSDGQPVIVATLMRSGTHLMIDSLLNNYKSLRRSPLYIDLDQYLIHFGPERGVKDILRAGSYVVKSHFPQLGGNSAANYEWIGRLAEESTVITVERKLADVAASYSIFSGKDRKASDFEKLYAEYRAFWQTKTDVTLHFNDLITDWDTCISRVRAAIPLQADESLRPPLGVKNKARVYTNKLLTRLMGKCAPRIDTTISFGLRHKEKGR